MGKNKIVAIIISVSILAAIILLVIFLGKKKNNNLSDNNQNQENISANLLSVDQIPVDSQIFVVNNPTLELAVRNSYEAFVDQTVEYLPVPGFIGAIFQDKNGQPVLLRTFLKSMGAYIPDSILKSLDEKKIEVISCKSSEENINFSLRLEANNKVDNANINLEFSGWEKTMLKDIHSVVFPQIAFSDSQFNQNMQFRDGKYRYADLPQINGQKLSINYGIFNKSVIISSSPNCIDKIVSKFEKQ